MSIEIRHLNKAFGEKQVLRDLSHTFPDGRITCMCGPSGCGKTTLLRILAGLLPADSGEVRGVDPRKVSVLFQEDRLIGHLSAADNVRVVLPREYPPEEILASLAAVGLTKADAVGSNVRSLSGGMRRRTALVRALLFPAPIILMDEPFKGLDPDTRLHTIAFTKSRLQDRTALIITHDVQDAADLGAAVFTMPPKNS